MMARNARISNQTHLRANCFAQACSAHGLRKAGAATAAENGATERQLMAMFGWSTLKEASRYTRSARQKILATAGMQHLSRHQNEPKG
jgi:site-specific recombinase XerD